MTFLEPIKTELQTLEEPLKVLEEEEAGSSWVVVEKKSLLEDDKKEVDDLIEKIEVGGLY